MKTECQSSQIEFQELGSVGLAKNARLWADKELMGLEQIREKEDAYSRS